MTLLDAPAYDEDRERRRQLMLCAALALVPVLILAGWLLAGRPVDWPWNWSNYFEGRHTANLFLGAVERNELPRAYGIWQHDPQWQQHPARYAGYSFDRFQQDWSPTSSENPYGAIHSHRIAAATMYGNQLLLAILINGDGKKNALALDYDPVAHSLNFPPQGVEIELGQ